MSVHRIARLRASSGHALRPTLERLEDRALLYAASGGLWTYGSRVTYSFAPDGTDIGGVSSAWFRTMSARGISEASWKAAFQKAAATWESVAGVNLVLVPDDGSRFGTPGNQQGDSRFGDIRVGAVSLPSGTLAQAFLPPPFNGGTLAGDIVMNTQTAWQASSDYDIQTVALHEFGHALGLDHSTVAQAVMYSNYTGVKQSLNTDDASGIRSVYGTRVADAFEPANTLAAAASLTSLLNSTQQLTLASLDISSTTDVDWFSVAAPAGGSGTLTVTMQSAGLSSLSPKLAVTNSSNSTLASVQAAGAFGATITATVSGVVPGQILYIKAFAASSGPTSVGAYGLQINFAGGSMSPIPPPNTTVAAQPDQGGGSAALDSNDPDHVESIAVGEIRAPGHSLVVSPSFRPGLRITAAPSDPAPDVAMPLAPLTLIDIEAAPRPRPPRRVVAPDLALALWRNDR